MEPPITESEARSAGWELEDYESEELTVWPDNWPVVRLFSRVCDRWYYEAPGIPAGLRWEAVYPLMERMGLQPGEWDALAADLEVMADAACGAIRERIAQQRARA